MINGRAWADLLDMWGWRCEVWGNRGKWHSFQESRKTKAKFLGEQGTKDIAGVQGTQENKFSIFGEQEHKPIYLGEHVYPPPPRT